MNIDYLTQLLTNKLTVLSNAKIQAFNSGDQQAINGIDEEILGVQDTLTKLRLLQIVDVAAAAANTTSSNIVATGIQAVQNNAAAAAAASATVTTTDTIDIATGLVDGYDISTYASDPDHTQKIANILQQMGAMANAADIDAYISGKYVGSPLTGQMILTAASQYTADVRLLMALMELDSQFGTVGVAVTTFNPGNVGNTGTATKTFGSWSEGVLAVADWLNSHRATATATTTNTTTSTATSTTATATSTAPSL